MVKDLQRKELDHRMRGEVPDALAHNMALMRKRVRYFAQEEAMLRRFHFGARAEGRESLSALGDEAGAVPERRTSRCSVSRWSRRGRKGNKNSEPSGLSDRGRPRLKLNSNR